MKVMVIGDSTGVSASHNATEFLGNSPWTECVIAQQLLEEKFGVGSFTFINKSAGGSGFGEWLYGSTTFNTESFKQLLERYPEIDLFYVQLGINDALRKGSVSGVIFAINQMYQMAKDAGKRMIFATPNPVNVTNRPEVLTLLSEMSAAILKTARGLGMIVVNHWDAATATGVWTKLLADGVHPIEEYYRFKGQTLFLTFAYTDFTKYQR